MKSRLVVLMFFLFLQCSWLLAQTLKKGNVVVLSTYTYTLKPGVTIDEWKEFYINKYIPEYEKNFQGVKEYYLFGDRGDKKNQFAVMDVFESVEVRNRYSPVENGPSFTDEMIKMESINKEAGMYFVNITRTSTDWIVQN